MSDALRSSSRDLRDLADAPLIDAATGLWTGLRLQRWIGSGGMAAVFSAELDADHRSADIARSCPRSLAVKLLLPELARNAKRINYDPEDIFIRETVALGRMMERGARCENVVGFYGSGRSVVTVEGSAITLPWLAIELVSGGEKGNTLFQRVRAAPSKSGGGVDPPRALRLARGILDGAIALHGEGIVHRDIKPDNILIAGSAGAEVPKLADCGIARVNGLLTLNLLALTKAYSAPEQYLSQLGERNPLIGPWTDVHALAAVLWFLLRGTTWHDVTGPRAWLLGERRRLTDATPRHDGSSVSDELLSALADTLHRGASPRLPEAALEHGDPDVRQIYLSRAKGVFPSMFRGVPRYATAEELRDAVLPLLEEHASSWEKSAEAPAEGQLPVKVARSEIKTVPEVRDTLVEPDTEVEPPR